MVGRIDLQALSDGVLFGPIALRGALIDDSDG
jgi:hypothetical protein